MSKIISFQIPKSEKSFVQYQEDRGKSFYNNFHQHPQCQLTLIIEGKGQLLAGDYVGRFVPGDMYLLGENIPHVFRSDSEYYEENSNLKVAGSTLFFDFAVFGKSIVEVEEFQQIMALKQQINGCFKIEGKLNDILKGLFQGFQNLNGISKLQRSIQILSFLDFDSEDMIPLNLIPMTVTMNERDGKRMDKVMRYILENSDRHISLEEIASQAYMSKEAFCRFFKLRTRKTFTQYVQQLRVTEAKKLLLETDMGISQISYQVGFQTLSHFNKTFKLLTKQTPKSWRLLN